MRLVFVHGWSVANTNTYGGLPAALSRNAPANLDLQITHLHLAKYVSFADEVTVEDIARGMQHAVAREVLPTLGAGERFACVTHSTGGPVVRKWIDLFYRGDLGNCPLGHLVMLAPANHGSALAQLGKGRISRIKAFVMDGVEPGTAVLDWLELGSVQSWTLNADWLGYDCVAGGLFPFVLIGQKIDRKMYDNMNSYTDEAGSDGVVRVAAANMNYGLVRLVQDGGGLILWEEVRMKPTAFGVLPGLAHSGKEIGVMRSVGADDDGSHPTVRWVLRCLEVADEADYVALMGELDQVTAQTQDVERVDKTSKGFLFEHTFVTDRYCMLVVRIRDDRGNLLTDYDVVFTAGPGYDPNHLPPGFFVDRQRNLLNRGMLTYYIDYDVMAAGMSTQELKGCFGFKIIARPDEGYAYYAEAKHEGTFDGFKDFLAPNRTMLVDIELKRHVMEGVFRLTQDLGPENFSRQPKGDELPPGK